MKLVDRYVLRELVLPLCIGASIALFMLLGTVLFAYADEILRRHVPMLLVLEWLALRLPDLAVYALPMAMAFSVSLAVNRLARDGEITPMRMAGTPFRRLAAPLLAGAFTASVLSYLTAEYGAPWAYERANQIERRMLMLGSPPTARSRVFLDAGDYTFYIGTVSRLEDGRSLLQDVLVYDTSRPGLPVWYYARDAVTQPGSWVLREVVRHDLRPDHLILTATRLPELSLDLEEDIDLSDRVRSRSEMRRSELLARARALADSGNPDSILFVVDHHFRFALPLACLVFGAIAAPVSLHFSRGGTFAGVLVSVVIGFLHWNALYLARLLGYNGVLAPPVAAWLPDLLFGAAAIGLLWQADAQGRPRARRSWCIPRGRPPVV